MLAQFFKCESKDLPFLLSDEIRAWRENPMDPIIVKKGPANEVIEKSAEWFKSMTEDGLPHGT